MVKAAKAHYSSSQKREWNSGGVERDGLTRGRVGRELLWLLVQLNLGGVHTTRWTIALTACTNALPLTYTALSCRHLERAGEAHPAPVIPPAPPLQVHRSPTFRAQDRADVT